MSKNLLHESLRLLKSNLALPSAALMTNRTSHRFELFSDAIKQLIRYIYIVYDNDEENIFRHLLQKER